MKPPTIVQARALCEALKARGVVVLAFDHDTVNGASYGETRNECRQLGQTLGRCMELIESGAIPVWDKRRVRLDLPTSRAALHQLVQACRRDRLAGYKEFNAALLAAEKVLEAEDGTCGG